MFNDDYDYYYDDNYFKGGIRTYCASVRRQDWPIVMISMSISRKCDHYTSSLYVLALQLD